MSTGTRISFQAFARHTSPAPRPCPERSPMPIMAPWRKKDFWTWPAVVPMDMRIRYRASFP